MAVVLEQQTVPRTDEHRRRSAQARSIVWCPFGQRFLKFATVTLKQSGLFRAEGPLFFGRFGVLPVLVSTGVIGLGVGLYRKVQRGRNFVSQG